MKTYLEMIREMSADQLAGFLTESGAEMPVEFCDTICEEDKQCEDCQYLGERGTKKAWEAYLNTVCIE
jgi:hypothetical protein